jgi:type I restriction enzyme S subunit
VAALNPSKSEVSSLAPDTEVSFLPMEAIGEDGSHQLDQVRSLSDVLTGYTFFKDGDVAIAKITPCFENGKGAVMRNLRNGIGFGTTELIVARPRAAVTTSSFLHWLFSSHAFRQAGEAFMYGAGGQKRVPDDFVRNFATAFPPLPEQHQVVAFLDRETAKIDALVEEQKRLIELLKEKRQAVISQAVTKGLDPSVPMKDSGVAWLGEVPAHWVVMPIRVAARLESGHTPSRSRPDWWENCTVPWFTLADVWQIRQGADVIYETEEKVSELGLANSSARRLPKGTVMLSRTASVGFSAIMGIDMATTQDFANWVCGDKVLPEFLLCVFRSMSGEFRRLMMGSTHNTIYMPDIQALRFALPPIPEQRNIVEHVRKAVASFDGLTNEAQRGVDLLTERRSALISAAVTGKIDVRGLAPH